MAVAAMPYRRAMGGTAGGEVPAIGLNGQHLTLKSGDIVDLQARLQGEVITATQSGYDAARQLWNGAFDRKPAVIVRCVGAADVRQAVGFASGHGLLTAVRGGGHSFAGYSGCDGGLVIDLAPMRTVRVDPIARVAQVGSGTLIGQMDRETQAFGLATPLGDSPGTGVAGLTLGGGLGWLRGRFGLTADNLLAADLVAADGNWLHASATDNPELLWALRGGGGNFGVVTAFTFRLHEVPGPMFGGTLAFEFADARRLLRGYAEICADAPDDLSLGVDLAAEAGGVRTVELAVCYSGPISAAERVVAPLRKLGKPLRDELAPTTYLQMQGSMDPPAVSRRGACVRGGLAYALTPSFIDAAVDYIEAAPPAPFVIELFNLGGAIGRVDPRDTAYWDRRAAHALLIWGEWTIPGDGAERNTEWVRGAWKVLEPYTRGYYANFPSADDSDKRIRAGYGDNYARLARIKKRYDPTNLFRLNANIKPA